MQVYILCSGCRNNGGHVDAQLSHFLNSLGFPRVEAESDCTMVIEYCSGQTRWWDAVAAIFAECVDVSLAIGNVIFKHCNCSPNNAAHVLASHSFCNTISDSWIGEPPSILVFGLVDDIISV